MFNFGKKYCISVENYLVDKNTLYIKDVNENTLEYSTTFNIKLAKHFNIEKAGEIANTLRNKNKGVSYKVCLSKK